MDNDRLREQTGDFNRIETPPHGPFPQKGGVASPKIPEGLDPDLVFHGVDPQRETVADPDLILERFDQIKTMLANPIDHHLVDTPERRAADLEELTNGLEESWLGLIDEQEPADPETPEPATDPEKVRQRFEEIREMLRQPWSPTTDARRTEELQRAFGDLEENWLRDIRNAEKARKRKEIGAP